VTIVAAGGCGGCSLTSLYRGGLYERGVLPSVLEPWFLRSAQIQCATHNRPTPPVPSLPQSLTVALANRCTGGFALVPLASNEAETSAGPQVADVRALRPAACLDGGDGRKTPRRPSLGERAGPKEIGRDRPRSRGAVFGELSALLDQPHTTDVHAIEPSQFHVADAVTLLTHDPIALALRCDGSGTPSR
jgi:hypothetical protein